MGMPRYLSTQPTFNSGDNTELQSDSRGNLLVSASGSVSAGAADSGNPVKVGGKYNSSQPTLSSGQRGDLQLTDRGNLRIEIWSGTTSVSAAAAVDGYSGQNGLFVWDQQQVFNGLTWDRVRTPNVFKPLAAVSVAAEITIWTPTSGKKFRLMGFSLSTGVVAGNITLKDNTAGTTIFVIPAAIANTPIVVNLGNGILSAAANNVLTATGSATETLSGTIWGTEE